MNLDDPTNSDLHDRWLTDEEIKARKELENEDNRLDCSWGTNNSVDYRGIRVLGKEDVPIPKPKIGKERRIRARSYGGSKIDNYFRTMLIVIRANKFLKSPNMGRTRLANLNNEVIEEDLGGHLIISMKRNPT